MATIFIMLYGAAACGKSEMAEELCAGMEGRRLYVATMRPRGGEARSRIERHRALRAGKGFETMEYYGNLANLKLPGDGRYRSVLLECAGNAVANALFERHLSPGRTLEGVKTGVDGLLRRADNLVLVTNDVFADGVCYEEGTGMYLNCMARVNGALAQRADAVVEVVCGLPVYHKGSYRF